MSTFLASQETLTSLTDKFDGKIPVRIHFLDNSSKVFLISSSDTVLELIKTTLEKYGLPDVNRMVPLFGLFESKNGSTIDRVLSLEMVVSEVLSGWANSEFDKTAKFLFMVRLQMPSIWGIQYRDVVAYRDNKPNNALSVDAYLDEAETLDANLLHLQFMQAVYNIITGKYPTTADEAVLLGAIHFLFKFGDFNPSSHKPGFLGGRIVEFIPVKHLKSGQECSLEAWEVKLLTKVQALTSKVGNVVKVESQNREDDGAGDSDEDVSSSGANVGDLQFLKNGRPISAQRKYMDLVYAMPHQGCSFYKCSQKVTRLLPETVFLGLFWEGVKLFDKSKKFLRYFHIEEILRWGFKPNALFYFEVGPDDALGGVSSLDFDTTEGKVMSDLLTDYAMAFLKEREEEEARLELMQRGQYPLKATGKHKRDKSFSASAPLLPTPKSVAPGSVNLQPSPAAAGKQSQADFEYRAATKLQALFRGYALRRDWVQEDAAILIQAVFRGFRARVFLSHMIEAMINRGELTY